MLTERYYRVPRILFILFILFKCYGFSEYSLDWRGANDQEYISSSEWNRAESTFYPNYTDNPLITNRMKRMINPYLLPTDHPAYSAMGTIFSHSGIIKNKKSVRKAGFKILFSQKKSHIYVLKHPLLRGYLLKVYLDSERKIPKGMPGWKRLTMRCVVAEKIKSIIAKHNFRCFIVADKWVYPIPADGFGSGSSQQQPVVLLAKDMNIYNSKTSAMAWRKRAGYETMRELFEIFRRGYGSAFLVGNLPYTHSGRFAFIDTEFGKRRLPMVHLSRYFSPRMRTYWWSLLQKSRAVSRKDLNLLKDLQESSTR
jgi:hypothetical protein